MNIKYLLLTMLCINASALYSQEAYKYEEGSEPTYRHHVQHEDMQKIIRIARIISGICGIAEGIYGSHHTVRHFWDFADHRMYTRGSFSIVSLFNGILTLHRGVSDEVIQPEDTGLFKKIMALLGVFSLKPFTTINGATILWESLV